MKVFMVTEFFWPSIGGLENSTAYLAKALCASFEVEILAVQTERHLVPGLPQLAQDLEIRFFSGDTPYQQMQSYIEADPDPEICVCFFGFSDAWTDDHLVFLSHIRRHKARAVTLKIPSLNEFSLYINHPARQSLLLHADYLICPNEAIQQELWNAGIPDEKTIVRFNGVPTSRFAYQDFAQKKALRAELGITGQPTFIFTGRFAARKRIQFLVDAFRKVPEANLLLVGYFDNRFDSGSSFDGADEKNIFVRGPVYDVRPFLKASDGFISASVAEGMPNSLLEAMSCGLPGLVTAIPGHTNVIKSGLNGELYDPDDNQDLVEKLRFWANAPLQWEEMSSAARQTVVDRFNIQDVANTYRRILNERSK